MKNCSKMDVFDQTEPDYGGKLWSNGCGGGVVVVFLWWCGGAVVFLWWCGVFVVVFLWWCCSGVLVVVFLWW